MAAQVLNASSDHPTKVRGSSMPKLTIRNIMIVTAIVAINFAAFRYPFGLAIPILLLVQSVAILLAVRNQLDISVSPGCIWAFALTLVHAFCISLYFTMMYRMNGIIESVLRSIVDGLACWPYAVGAAGLWLVSARSIDFCTKHFRYTKTQMKPSDANT